MSSAPGSNAPGSTPPEKTSGPSRGQGRGQGPGGRGQGQPGQGSGQGQGPQRPGSLQPTKATTLIVSAIAFAALGLWGMSRFFADIPNITFLPGLTLAALAVMEAVAAHNTKAKIEKKPRRGSVNPLLVARYAVLAKASSLAGAIFAGAYGGVAAWAVSQHGQLRVADADLPPSVAGLVGALALVGGALALERACRVPDPPDDDDKSDGTGSAGTTASRR
jgi:hypothetical protein